MTRWNIMKYFTLYVLVIHVESSKTQFHLYSRALVSALCLTTPALLPAVSVFCSSLSQEVPHAKNSRVLPLYFILFLNIWLCFPAVLAYCSYTAEKLLNTSAVPQHFGMTLPAPQLWRFLKQLKDRSLMRFAE